MPILTPRKWSAVKERLNYYRARSPPGSWLTSRPLVRHLSTTCPAPSRRRLQSTAPDHAIGLRNHVGLYHAKGTLYEIAFFAGRPALPLAPGTGLLCSSSGNLGSFLPLGGIHLRRLALAPFPDGPPEKSDKMSETDLEQHEQASTIQDKTHDNDTKNVTAQILGAR